MSKKIIEYLIGAAIIAAILAFETFVFFIAGLLPW